jgi:hypothetical protein
MVYATDPVSLTPGIREKDVSGSLASTIFVNVKLWLHKTHPAKK